MTRKKTDLFKPVFSIFLFLFAFQAISNDQVLFKSANTKKISRYIKKLKAKNINYKIKKSSYIRPVYLVSVQDYKRYKNSRIKTKSRILIKNKLFFIQYITASPKKALEVKKLLIKNGILARHIKFLKRKRKINMYSIIKSKETQIPSWIDEVDTRMAQTRINTHFGSGKDFVNNYGSVVTGMEFDHPGFLFKLKGRAEYYQEDYDETVIELDETYITKQIGNSQMTIGKQLFSWGAFDEFSTFDRVNIKNIQRFVFDAGEAFRRPISGIRLENYFGAFKLDAFYDFGLESGRKIVEESRFSGYDRENGRIRSADPELIDPTLVKNVNTYYQFRDKQSFGLRLSYSSDFDLSLNYLRAYNDYPMVEISKTLRSEILTGFVTNAGLAAGLTLAYYQEEVIGVDFAKTWWGQLFKFEAALINDTPVIDENLTLQKYSKSRFAMGGDIELDSLSSTITWQFVNEKLLTSDEILLNKELTQYIIQTTTSFWLEKARTGIRFVANSNDTSFYLAPYIDYDYSDRLIMGLSYHYFEGEPETFFGFNRDDKFASFNLKYLF